MKIIKNSTLIFVFIFFSTGINWGNSILDTINWQNQIKTGCLGIKEVIMKPTEVRSLNPNIILNCGICALKLGEPQLTLEYIKTAEEYGLAEMVATKILKLRAYCSIKNDKKALSLLSNISALGDIRTIYELPEIKAFINRNPQAMKMYMASKPSFDLFSFLIAVICFVGFFVSILFLIKNRETQSYKWLSYFILNFTIIMSSYVIYWTRFSYDFPYLNDWWHCLYLLIGPLFYFYVVSIFKYKIKIFQYLIHTIPFFTCLFYLGYSGRFSQSTFPNTTNEVIGLIFLRMPIKIISLIYYFFISYKMTIGDWQVDINIKKWTNNLFVFFGIFIAANIVYFLLLGWSGFNADWDYFISGVMAVGIIGVASVGFLDSKYLDFGSNIVAEKIHKRSDIIHESISNVKEIKYKSSSLTTKTSQSIKGKIEEMMEIENIFLNEELRLQDIADKLGIHRNHISQAINENYNMNYFDWVNKYRVYHAAKLLSIPNCPYTISQVGFESGFNNKVTFYKVFREYFKCTPLEYITRLENERAKMS